MRRRNLKKKVKKKCKAIIYSLGIFGVKSYFMSDFAPVLPGVIYCTKKCILLLFLQGSCYYFTKRL